MKITLVLLLCLFLVGCNSMALSKFITSGQNADNVPVFSQVIHGNSLKPLSPANVRGSRNAVGDLLIEWMRRSRIGSGLRPFSEVPIAEETEFYDIEIYSGTTLKRTWRVPFNQSQPVIWESYKTTADSTISELSNGGLSFNYAGFGSGNGGARSRQNIYGDCRFEVSVYKTGGTQYPLPYTVGLVSAGDLSDVLGRPPSERYWSGSPPSHAFAETFATDAGPMIDYDRLMIEFIGGEVRYYKNYAGPGSVPFFVSILTSGISAFPLTAHISFDSDSAGASEAVRSAILQRLSPDAFYGAALQVADFGSTQSSIKVRVYQVSAIVGRGSYTEATL